MLLKIKNINQTFALGLRWLVATRQEIDYLKERENLSYGFVNAAPGSRKNHYKSAVLTGSENNRAISLAGILSEKYQHLIFAHKVQADLYWLCIIKDHEIWNDLDLGESTAGDFLCSKERAEEIIQAAQDLFIENEISYTKITYASTQTQESFPHFQAITLTELLQNTKRYFKKYRITWLQSHKKQIKRIISWVILLSLVVGGTAYIYSSQNSAAREKARLTRLALEKQRLEQERIAYFDQLDNHIYETQGSHSIAHVLELVGSLSIHSAGWDIIGINYASISPEQLKITLKRGQYGDILSFRNSYAKNTIQEQIADDNNQGTKTLQFTGLASTTKTDNAKIAVITKILSNKIPTERYRLIAYGQRLGLNFQTSPVATDRYGLLSSDYTMSGENMWNLRKLQFLFEKFATITIDTISMTVGDDNAITWNIKGKIYG